MDFAAVLEWKLVRERGLLGSENNPEGTVRVDAEFNISAIDLVVAFCRSTTQDYSGQIIRRLIRARKEKLSESDLIYIDRPGTDERIVLVPYRNAVKLMMLLPGQKAMQNREIFAEVLHQYYAGHDKIKKDLDKNKVSETFFNAMARASLAALLSAEDQTPESAAAAAATAAAAYAAFDAAVPASNSSGISDVDGDDAMSGDTPSLRSLPQISKPGHSRC